MRIAYALVLLAFASGCAASTEPADGTTSDAVITEEGDLRDQIRTAYEADRTPLEDERDAAMNELPGEAREAFNYYASSGLMADVGGTIATVGTFRGQTLYFVAGDVSDTGSEYGFYDAKGKLLALAYTGQGEHPGPGGVHWID